MKKRVNWKVFLVSLLIVYFFAFLGSLFTSSAVKTPWYESVKPSITPPNWLFPVVWTVLFFLIAVSLYLSWIYSRNKKTIALVFGINLFLNFLWSVIYFGMRNPQIAFFEIILLWLSILAMMSKSYKVNKTACYLLLPYIVWVSFAAVLNYLSVF